MVNILITGGTGFIGIPLVKKLHEMGHKLKLLVRESSDISAFENLKDIEYIIGDLRDIESIREASSNIDYIYHLAALTEIWHINKKLYEDINVGGSENIAQVALENKITLIYVSSFFAIGPYEVGEPVPNFETHERKKDFFMEYEKTKAIANKKIKEFKEKALNVITFYPGFVYGPGDFNFYGKLTIDIINDSLLGIPKNSISQFSMTYVYDIANILPKAINRNDLIGEDFFIGGETVSTIDYMNLIAEIAGVKQPRKFPMWVASLYGRICELKSKITKKTPYMTCALIKMATLNWAYSSEKAVKELGYKITPFKEGLEQTVKWYQEYLTKKEEK
ncbi:MAG: NAD-dependent epimerase/dehydratase family protein [Candidatus Lokiarchaeota archaeon]|jgi:farnesol dehydrogenase